MKNKKKSWKSTMMGEEWNKLDHGWRMEDGEGKQYVPCFWHEEENLSSC